VARGLMCGSAAAGVLAGIAGSNLFVVSDVLSDRRRYDGSIPRPEEPNRVCDQV